jgi:hypothetical protein
MTTAALPSHDLRSLLEYRADCCLSLFLPTHRGGPGIQQDAIRLKNLLRDAADRLSERGLSRLAIDELLAPARGLLDERELQRDAADGLALFLAPDYFQARRVPLALEERIEIGREFEIRPLLPLLVGDGRFYLLALSQNANQLYEATRDSIRAVDTPGMPKSLAEALRFDDPERQLQFHTRTGAPRTGGRRSAMFHGQGVGVDDDESNLLRYCQQIDRALANALAEERAPLVVASVDHEQAMYREVSSYPFILARGIAGNPELKSPEELLREAWPIVEPELRRDVERARERFGDLSATALASTSVEEIVPAGAIGRVETLFVDRAAEVRGRFDEAAGRVERVGGNDDESLDLLDLAARRTLARGGVRYALEPVSEAAAARTNQSGRGPLDVD